MSACKAKSPCAVVECYKTPKSHPWRQVYGCGNVQFAPLPQVPLTNLVVDAVYVPKGMIGSPLRFPNLVTGYNRNPSHAARAALYTRYTPIEWDNNQVKLVNEVNKSRHCSETMRKDAFMLMREADQLVAKHQGENDRRLGEKLTDTSFWRGEASLELDRMIDERAKMQECSHLLAKALQDIEAPLHIAEECLYFRECRKGIDMVHDEPERALLKEVETIRNSIKNLERYTSKCTEQLRKNRSIQNELEMDITGKEYALGIDTLCHQLNKFSRGLQYYHGIEKNDFCELSPNAWIEQCNSLIKRSQMERSHSCQLRSDILNDINLVAKDIWGVWNNSNDALFRRIAEIQEAKNNLQLRLHEMQKEIFNIEKAMELLNQTILDKGTILKVAHTRLEARNRRPLPELACRDCPNVGLMKEVNVLNGVIKELQCKLQQSVTHHENLLRTRNNLEEELKSKVDALFIDREKCMGIRRTFPISATVKY